VVIFACRFDVILGPGTFSRVKMYTVMAQYPLCKSLEHNIRTALSDASHYILVDLVSIITQRFCTEVVYR
jgi:hypothetical protein